MMANLPVNSENNKEVNTGNTSNGFIRIFLSTFISLFIAELGDKTQIATLLLSAQSGRPIIVFVGSALALICSTLVVVILGKWLSKTFPNVSFNLISGYIMIGLGIWLGFQSIQGFISLINK